ncbi:hypothetical protein [Streptomyces sp. NRRL B-1347]|uniref:hypothetical protein n=1 Tax=Streptomyces sp. NRRL B-1347 TaxID=1476877 RepID=UPI002D21A715|nr:hypothetical protein [Streptomyces sp. NRRL B-1347]
MHRVVNPPDGDTSSRLTIPFFYLPNHDATIEPLRPGGARGGHGTPVIAGEWMSNKIRKMFAGTA